MVVYDSQVKQQLEEYDISLKSYPISASRRKEKVRRLRQFLQSIGRNVLSYPICDSKKLGQAFNAVNKPIDASLRQTHYQDESGTQWRMSFFMVSKNVVKIYRLYQAQFVDESLKIRTINRFKIEYKDNTMKTNKKVVRLTESELHNLISESVKQVLSELDWRSYASGGKKAKDDFLNMIKNGSKQDDPNLLKRVRQARNLLHNAVETSRDKFKDMNDEDNTFYTTVDGNGVFYPNVENSSWDGRPMQMDIDYKTKMRGLSKSKAVNVTPNRYLGYDDEKVSDWNRFSKEVNDFNNGKSTYIKGKGWQ